MGPTAYGHLREKDKSKTTKKPAVDVTVLIGWPIILPLMVHVAASGWSTCMKSTRTILLGWSDIMSAFLSGPSTLIGGLLFGLDGSQSAKFLQLWV